MAAAPGIGMDGAFSGRLRSVLGRAIDAGVERAITTRWEHAIERAATVEGATVDERVAAVVKTYARELGGLGAAAGGVAAVPTVGTTAALTTAMSEFTWFTVRVAEMILTIAALHGHTRAELDERRRWVATLLAFGDDAADQSGNEGSGLGPKVSSAIPLSSLSRINQSVSRKLICRYGTRRGVVALGSALPFGIGMAVGATANYGSVRLLGRQAHQFFSTLRSGKVIDVTWDQPG